MISKIVFKIIFDIREQLNTVTNFCVKFIKMTSHVEEVCQ